MLDERCSIRYAARELNIPKSTVHFYIHEYIPHLDDDVYVQLQHLLRDNKKYKTGKRWKRGRR